MKQQQGPGGLSWASLRALEGCATSIPQTMMEGMLIWNPNWRK